MSPSSVARGFKQVLNKQSLPNLLTVTSVVFWFLLQHGLFLFWYAVGVKWSNSGKNESSFVSTLFSVNRLGYFSFPSTFPSLSQSLSVWSLSLCLSMTLLLWLSLLVSMTLFPWLSLSLCVCFKDGELWWLRFGDECLARPSVPFLCSETIVPYPTPVHWWSGQVCLTPRSKLHETSLTVRGITVLLMPVLYPGGIYNIQLSDLYIFFKTSFCCLPFLT